MSTINLGNIVGNRVQGIASGLDTENLIKELSQARQKPIDSINLLIDKNKSRLTEYGKLNSLMTTLKSALNYLRNPQGIGSSISNIFQYRIASLSSSTLTSANYLSVAANPGALKGSTTIEIGQIAKALEQRSGSFNARNIDVTTGATGASFTAGTFQIGSGVVNSVTGTSLSGYQTVSGDYNAEGDATGTVITTAGLHNFIVTGGSGGQSSLKGSASSFSVSNISAGTAILSVAIGGTTYSTGAVQVDNAVTGGTGITAGTTFTFTADSGGANETSFDITVGASDIVIDNTQANLDDFGSDVADALSGQVVYQARQLTNFTDANVKSPLIGLTSTDVKFYTNAYGTAGAIGSISGFNVVYGAGNTSSISVDINGETFRATGLSTPLNSLVTLHSTTTEKELRIDLTGVGAALASDSDAVNIERGLDYAFGTRKLVDVTVSAGDTLNDVIFNINQLASQTGVSAAVTKVSDVDYRFSLKANNEGIDNKYEIFDGSGVLTNASLTTTQSAQDSKFRVDGVELTRSTNSVTDAIENVTLNLAAVTPDYNEITPQSIELKIDNDVDTVSGGIVTFLNAFNALRVYYTEQNQRDPNTNLFLDTSILGGDSVLQNFNNLLVSYAGSTASGASSGSFDSLTDLGISFSDFAGDDTTVATKNILTYDQNKLANFLSTNFDKVREIFEFKYTSSSSDLALFKSSNSFTLNSFKLRVDTSASSNPDHRVQLLNADGTDYLDGDNQPVYLTYTASSGKITGQAGTVVDGLEFIYTGDGSDTIAVGLSQGIADKIYNLTDAQVKSGGILDTAKTTLVDKNQDYDGQIRNLQERLDEYVKNLRAKFTALENALSSVNNILQLLDANSAAATKNG